MQIDQSKVKVNQKKGTKSTFSKIYLQITERLHSTRRVYTAVLTYICHVQAALLRGVVPPGGDGRHVHTVHLPDGRVAAVEVAAVGTARHVVGTFFTGTFTVEKGERDVFG